MRNGEEQGPEESPTLSEAGRREEVKEETEKERPRRLWKGKDQETIRGEKWLANPVAIGRKGRIKTGRVSWIQKPVRVWCLLSAVRE